MIEATFDLPKYLVKELIEASNSLNKIAIENGGYDEVWSPDTIVALAIENELNKIGLI
jgi:hypothetical protein